MVEWVSKEYINLQFLRSLTHYEPEPDQDVGGGRFFISHDKKFVIKVSQGRAIRKESVS